MWFDPGLAGLFITSTLLHLGEDINLLVVSSPKPITMIKYLSSNTDINYESCMNVVIRHVIEKSQVFEKTK
jgi:hypothetical protein